MCNNPVSLPSVRFAPSPSAWHHPPTFNPVIQQVVQPVIRRVIMSAQFFRNT